ncbi:MAG: endonuclease III [Verrucomicrobiales bacterium]|nr:endonuclease III [Verrucomicrobiales bacterium]MCP5560714.1 endonuclease III [Verrucomicrobiaceae bacterium]
MTKLERARFIQQKLAELYPHPPIPLDHQDPFTLLVAVLLSAQCTDVRVNQITPALFALGSTPEALAKQPVSVVEDIVRPCGLGPQKARAIVGLSQILMRDHGGKVPADLEILETLPGVGHKTAQVVMAQAFGIPSFPVDTHIHRLAQRWKLTDGRSVIQTERDLKRIFPQDSWNVLHLQIIFYGREHCSARSCDGTTCLICSTCFPNQRRPTKTRKA